jgi:hypothetical protein
VVELADGSCQSILKTQFFSREIHANISYGEEGIANEMETIAASKLQMRIDLLLAYDWAILSW